MNTIAAKTSVQPVLLLTRNDVKRLLSIEECTAAVEDAFRQFGEGKLQPPGMLGTHAAGGGFHIKAGSLSVSGRSFYAAKMNANFPENPMKHGLPTIQGVVLLFDAECGTPLAIMDSIEITILRTGAATAIAAKYLARRNSGVATIIGCGMQSRIQARAIKSVLPIDSFYTCDIDHSRAQALADELSREPNVRATAVSDFAAATAQSDVIVTCTTSKAAFLREEHVRPGTFIAAVGADNEEKRELDTSLISKSRVIPDLLSQAASIGEIHHAIGAGALNAESIEEDLPRIVAGRAAGRRSDDEVIVFDSTGMALQDVASACATYAKAKTDEAAVAHVALN
jgi:alanine dehydrogenase